METTKTAAARGLAPPTAEAVPPPALVVTLVLLDHTLVLALPVDHAQGKKKKTKKP